MGYRALNFDQPSYGRPQGRVELDFRAITSHPGKLITPRLPPEHTHNIQKDHPLMEGGEEITDPVSLRAFYQLGDFEYQYVRKDGTRTRIFQCLSYQKLEQIARHVRVDNPTTVRLLRRQPQKAGTDGQSGH